MLPPQLRITARAIRGNIAKSPETEIGKYSFNCPKKTKTGKLSPKQTSSRFQARIRSIQIRKQPC